ncbi:unnamed protein product [Amoebophrya sp. A120]|nr:unnamed protein product [Amoebophrya sp. A120]|eukprot:GSA120T00004919001.1
MIQTKDISNVSVAADVHNSVRSDTVSVLRQQRSCIMLGKSFTVVLCSWSNRSFTHSNALLFAHLLGFRYFSLRSCNVSVFCCVLVQRYCGNFLILDFVCRRENSSSGDPIAREAAQASVLVHPLSIKDQSFCVLLLSVL